MESTPRKARILVIDDDDVVLRSVSKILDREGYDVEIAPNGEEGIDMARSGDFDLVLCDIRMPGLDGIMTVETIRKIQKRAGRKHSAFLFMTAYAEEHERSKHLGLTEILRKPFGLEDLRSAVSRHLHL